MMDNMEVGDIVEEESSLPPQEVTINSCGRTSLEVPFLVPVMGKIWCRMVKVCDHDDLET